MRTDNNTKIEFKNNRDWLKKELAQPRGKRFVKAYITMLLNGKMDYKTLGRIYRPDQKIPEASAKRLLKYQETRDMIDEQLQIALTDNNVTYDSLIKERQSLLKDSKDNDKYDIRLKTLEGFEDMLSMRVPRRDVKQITESVSYKQMLENGSKNEIIASQTRDIDTPKSAESSVKDTQESADPSSTETKNPNNSDKDA